MGGPAGKTEPYRLFAALWPDAKVREQLQVFAADWNRRHAGQLQVVPPERLHLTLVFIGAADAPALQRCQRACERVHTEPFSLRLERPGQFGRGRRRYVWLGPATMSAALRALQQGLHAQLSDAGFELENTRDFVPHVTVMRGRSRHDAPAACIQWPVQDFVLVNSWQDAQGLHYDVLGRYPLHSR